MPRASNPLKNYNHLFALESADSKELRKTFSVSRYEFTFEFAVLFFYFNFVRLKLMRS